VTALMDASRQSDGRYARGTPTEERLFGRTERLVSGCLVWTGRSNSDGYGLLSVDGGTMKVHRLAWELRHGPIPVGLGVLHTYDNPPCVEDSHHFLGTNHDNVLDRQRKGRSKNLFASGADHPATKRAGERHWLAKLSDADVQRMREMRSGGTRLIDIAAEFNVHHATVSRICRGEWR